MNMSRKQFLTLLLKVIIYICTLLLGFLGVSAMSSCSRPLLDIYGNGAIIVNDTIIIKHGIR